MQSVRRAEVFKTEKQRLLADEMLSAVTTLKQSGKIRFLATSSHGPHNVEKLMIAAAESGHFDVIMPAFNFMKFPKIPEVIKIAKKKRRRGSCDENPCRSQRY